eukprot:TRINITY_DN8991_c0_g1_i1.p1 TRINITY_DN8991_c0_g1~~TRINITY_DN8991_c0_g1_i1.p1  ORF type:complete len:352 (-),score=81.45 TRINITY_DN8991_c0_g1_i1:197-1252(-)
MAEDDEGQFDDTEESDEQQLGVVFTQGDDVDDAAWDDTLLVQQWEAAMGSHQAQAAAPLDKPSTASSVDETTGYGKWKPASATKHVSAQKPASARPSPVQTTPASGVRSTARPASQPMPSSHGPSNAPAPAGAQPADAQQAYAERRAAWLQYYQQHPYQQQYPPGYLDQWLQQYYQQQQHSQQQQQPPHAYTTPQHPYPYSYVQPSQQAQMPSAAMPAQQAWSVPQMQTAQMQAFQNQHFFGAEDSEDASGSESEDSHIDSPTFFENGVPLAVPPRSSGNDYARRPRAPLPRGSSARRPTSTGPNSLMPPLPEDETLANLLLSWYYSGYYTALYTARATPRSSAGRWRRRY